MANGFQYIELNRVLSSAEMLPDFLKPTDKMKSLSLKDGKKDYCFLSLSFLRNLEKKLHIFLSKASILTINREERIAFIKVICD